MNFEDKANSLANRMNQLTESFDLAEEMVVEGDDIIEFVEEKTKDISLYEDAEINPLEVVCIETMVSDFKYIRETLKETTDNGRRVLNAVTLDLLSEDEETTGDKRSALITSFAELNRSVGDNMKLYMQSYKDISTVILNIDKVQKTKTPSTVNNNLTIHNTEPLNTVDLISRLRGEE